MSSLLFPLIAACLTITGTDAPGVASKSQIKCQTELALCVLPKSPISQITMDRAILECMAKRKGANE